MEEAEEEKEEAEEEQRLSGPERDRGHER